MLLQHGRRWLLGLLVLQSTSSFVLEQYQQLLKEHLVVTVFLTMLVGAGGNAGNQSAIKVIRGLVSMPCRCCNLSLACFFYCLRRKISLRESCICMEQSMHKLAQCLSVVMDGVMQATGTIKTTWPSVRKTLTQQAYIGVLLGGGLSGSSGFCL